MPTSAVLELESKPATYSMVYSEKEASLIPMTSFSDKSTNKTDIDVKEELRIKQVNNQKLKEVEQQQTDFGEKN